MGGVCQSSRGIDAKRTPWWIAMNAKASRRLLLWYEGGGWLSANSYANFIISCKRSCCYFASKRYNQVLKGPIPWQSKPLRNPCLSNAESVNEWLVCIWVLGWDGSLRRWRQVRAVCQSFTATRGMAKKKLQDGVKSSTFILLLLCG